MRRKRLVGSLVAPGPLAKSGENKELARQNREETIQFFVLSGVAAGTVRPANSDEKSSKIEEKRIPEDA